MAKNTTFPLFKHRNGQWCKKVLGKQHYFGTDETVALNRWLDEKDYLLAGRVPPTKNTAVATVVELANLFADRCRRQVSAGEMVQRSADDYTPTLTRLIAIVGRDCRPENLTPLDFASLKEKLADPVPRTKGGRGGTFGLTVERRSPTTVAGQVRRIRAFLNWCHTSELIPAPRFGEDFAPITDKAQKRHESKAVRKDIPAADLRAIIEASSVTFKPLVLMAINAGIGNLDLCEMELSRMPRMDAAEVWFDLPRGKTGSPRRFVLWPETQAAIRCYLEARPRPAGHSNDNRLFLTKYGQAWIRIENGERTDAIGGAFTRFRKAAQVNRGTFYDCRRTFQTVAAETLDFPAVSFIMGHAKKKTDMAAKYTQNIGDDRLRVVCNHVRDWLFGADSEDAK